MTGSAQASDGSTLSDCAPAIEALVLAPDVQWDPQRHQGSPLRWLGSATQWQATESGNAELPEMGATLIESEGGITLTVDLTRTGFPMAPSLSDERNGTFSLTFDREATYESLRRGGVGVISESSVAEAMRSLCRVASGGHLAEVVEAEGQSAQAKWDTTLAASTIAEHTAVTTGTLRLIGEDEKPKGLRGVGGCSSPTADVLVGPSWPAIFAIVAHSQTAAGVPVVEGMLDLVHLNHHICLSSKASELLCSGRDVSVSVVARDCGVAETSVGRIISVEAELTVTCGDQQAEATMSEQFAVRDRPGKDEPAASGSGENGESESFHSTSRSFRGAATIRAPYDMSAFACVTGDFNPIHRTTAAARLAGWPQPIVHGMWLSAACAQVAAADGAEIAEWNCSMAAPVAPASRIEITVERTGIDSRAGFDEVRTVTATVDGNPVMVGHATTRSARTFYCFPGQGIQSQGMGMGAYADSAVARRVWDQADRRTREALGFSILTIVRDNPTEVVVRGQRYTHPQGVLYLTQFTQVAMAILAMAQVAQLEEAGRLDPTAGFAGHSVGEYTALASFAGALSSDSIVEIVYARGLTMHRLVPRDSQGRSSFGLAALRPHAAGIAAEDVNDFVSEIARTSGEFLEIVNHNVFGRQYAVAGSLAGLGALRVEAEKRAAARGQSRALIMIPGIDVPFHSHKLAGGVDAFREDLERLVPADIEVDRLVGKYVPNLVARPFELTVGFAESILEVVESDRIRDLIKASRGSGAASSEDELAGERGEVARTLLIELLAWQFASPVRWIETQDLIIRGGFGRKGVSRVIEVGVGQSPTLANMLGQTLTIPVYRDNASDIEVLNVERDAEIVFATDENIRDVHGANRQEQGAGDAGAAGSVDASGAARSGDAGGAAGSGDASGSAGQNGTVDAAQAGETDNRAAKAGGEGPASDPSSAPATPSTPEPAPAAAATTSTDVAASSSAAPGCDLPFGAADATRTLIALWTKVRPDQLTPIDTIEGLVDGVSSRRNQVLMDVGAEFGVGAIDGAAEAGLEDLCTTVSTLAGKYSPFGPVLEASIFDAIRRITGPVGANQSAIVERVDSVWQLGAGWSDHVLAALAMGVRDGGSVRGGELATLAPTAPANRKELDELIDSAVESVARAHSLNVAKPTNNAASGASQVDSAALDLLRSDVFGEEGILASQAALILDRIGVSSSQSVIDGVGSQEATAHAEHVAETEKIVQLVEAELGSQWPSLVAPTFDSNKAFVLDDRWATAREDLVIALASDNPVESLEKLNFHGAGDTVAQHAAWWAHRISQSKSLGHFADSADFVEGESGSCWSFDTETSQAVSNHLGRLADQATQPAGSLEFDGQIAVVTGASPNSIGGAVAARLLEKGATVIATASGLTKQRRQWLADLYRHHARGNAALWAVPANLASYSDIDALAQWIGNETTTTVGARTVVTKPAMTPDLLFPFAAAPVDGDATTAGGHTDSHLRILLTGLERLVTKLGSIGADTDVDHRLHVILPGSPNRGRFGGDGAYGESKAALDAFVTRWKAEKSWSQRVTLVHALIGWVKSTGLMSGNDAIAPAVEKIGVTTFTAPDMAHMLLSQASTEVRTRAQAEPVVVDFTGGLGEADIDLVALATQAREELHSDESTIDTDSTSNKTVAALPSAQKTWADYLGEKATLEPERFAQGTQRLEDMVVLVGAGELGPCGTSRIRHEIETDGELSAPGVVEMAWKLGLIEWNDDPTPGFYGAQGELIAEEDIAGTLRSEVMARIGIREFADDEQLHGDDQTELGTVYLESPLEFFVDSLEEAHSFVAQAPDHTKVVPGRGANEGRWAVTRLAGCPIRVPRHTVLTRSVGGQIPDGFNPAVYGIPADLCESLDRVALWNMVCTIDAFTDCGITPADVAEYIHPARISNTQGTGMGGMRSLRQMYINRLLGEPRPNDILQEALPNVLAAHVMQSYVGGYGQMIHPVAACATAAVSVEAGVDAIRLGKSDVVIAGGFDDISPESVTGFGAMNATADTEFMRASGLEDAEFSRANDRRRHGFVESAGGGSLILMRGSVAADLGLPVLGVVAFAQSFSDGAHTSIPAPGQGAVAAAMGGHTSPLATALGRIGATADDIAVISKHDTSTNANDPNESELHENIATAIGRNECNPLMVVSQKALTGHAKGGAAAFQLIGLTEILNSGVVPGNKNLECVDPELCGNERLVWLRSSVRPRFAPAVGLVTSLGFGHVSALVCIAHFASFESALVRDRGEQALAMWRTKAGESARRGARRSVESMYGGRGLYDRPVDRRLGSVESGMSPHDREIAVLLDPRARLREGVIEPGIG